MLDHTYHADFPSHLAEHALSSEELDFCFDFVIQTGLALLDADYRLIPEIAG